MPHAWYMDTKPKQFWPFIVKVLTPVPEHFCSSVVSGLPARGVELAKAKEVLDPVPDLLKQVKFESEI